MKSKIQSWILYLAIEYHWRFIAIGRKRLKRMYESGHALSSTEMLKVNNRVSRHCARVSILTEKHSELTGIK